MEVRLPYGARDFGEVRKPVPQLRCIVRRISGSERISPKDFPMTSDAKRIKRA
jgi:hypothetical protein